MTSSPMRFHRGLYEVHLPVTNLDRAVDLYPGKLEERRTLRKSQNG